MKRVVDFANPDLPKRETTETNYNNSLMRNKKEKS